jgi:regulator of protease activity HflC (stomatin/prohibitin superfamily)
MLEQLWDFLSSVPGVLWRWLWEFAKRRPVVVILVVVAIVRSFGTTVQSGQAGVLFSWGRARKVLEPGFHPLIPVMQQVRHTPIRSVTLDLRPQRVSTADGLVYDVDATVIYHVEDPIKALTSVDDVKRGVTNLVPLLVAELMRGQSLGMLSERSALDADLKTRAQEALGRWGLVVEQAGLNSIAPTRPTARLTQLGARVRERAALLREELASGVPVSLAVALVACGATPRSHSAARYHRHRLPARQEVRPPALPPPAASQPAT